MEKPSFLNVFRILAVAFLIGSIFTGPSKSGQAAVDAVGVPTGTIAEADDFAFVELGDAWDMNEFSDVSQYLNGFGRHPSLKNIQVQNGVFSAQSIGDYTSVLASFYPLFPGLPGFMEIENDLGSTHPINTQRFGCLYMAMKVNSPTGSPSDMHRVMWYADKNMSPMGSAPNGGMWESTYPENVGSNIVYKWKLFKIDLHNTPNRMGVRWGDRPSWPGLEIQPTIYKGIDFTVDWVRLTGCQNSPANQAQITWNPSLNVSAIWIQPQGTTRFIQVATGVSNTGAYTLDTKGLPSGKYKVGVGDINTCCSELSTNYLTINQSVLVAFDRPSPSSGEDYAKAGGNAWDMADGSDVTKIDCSAWSFANDLLYLDTLPPAQLPDPCKGSLGEADSRLFLNRPVTLQNSAEYRYLSFRMFIGGQVPLPVDGMMARWIWTSSDSCVHISADVGYDTGWHTYNVDLFNPFNGMPVSSSGCAKKHWTQAGKVIRLRFDPNENYTGKLVQPPMTFHQEFDWIRLTKVDRAKQGAVFPIEGTLNKDLSAITRLTLYYTTDPKQPTQHQIGIYSLAAQEITPPGMNDEAFTAPGAASWIYLPAITSNYVNYPPLGSNQFRYLWKTSGVPLGEYYICAQVNDGVNTTTDCSAAPLQIVSP